MKSKIRSQSDPDRPAQTDMTAFVVYNIIAQRVTYFIGVAAVIVGWKGIAALAVLLTLDHFFGFLPYYPKGTWSERVKTHYEQLVAQSRL